MITLDDLNASNKLFSAISTWALDLPEYKLLCILGQDKWENELFMKIIYFFLSIYFNLKKENEQLS